MMLPLPFQFSQCEASSRLMLTMANSEQLSIFKPFRIEQSQNPFPEKLRSSRAVVWKNTIIVFGGGYTLRDLGGYKEEAFRDPTIVHYYHCSGKWIRQETRGDKLPKDFYPKVVEILSNKIIVMSFCFRTRSWLTYSLCPVTWTWTWLEPGGQQPNTLHCRSSWVYNDKVYIFAGFVFDEELQPVHSNELSCYNASNNNWERAHQGGDIPSPRHGQVTIIVEDIVFLFGGHNNNSHDEQDSPEKELFMFDMKKMRWTRIHKSMDCPIGQRNQVEFHNFNSFTLISKSNAILFSSLAENCEVWLFNIDRAKQLEDPANIWTPVPNHFWRSDFAAVKFPLSQSVWLIGGYDGQAGSIASDILKISSHSIALKDLAIDYIALNMRSEDEMLLPGQIPQDLKYDIDLHKEKCY